MLDADLQSFQKDMMEDLGSDGRITAARRDGMQNRYDTEACVVVGRKVVNRHVIFTNSGTESNRTSFVELQ